MDIKTQLLEACAANLRDFGYPDANAENVLTAPILWAFASQMLKRHIEDRKPGWQEAQAILEQQEKGLGG